MHPTSTAPSKPSCLTRIFRWLFSWKTLRRAIMAVVVLFTLLAAYFTIERYRGRRAWEAFKMEMAAKGEKLSLQEILPPLPPDAENFAATPLLRPLLRYHYTNTPPKNPAALVTLNTVTNQPPPGTPPQGGPGPDLRNPNLIWEDARAVQRVQGIDMFLKSAKGVNVPSWGSSIKGQPTDLAPWSKFYVGNTNYPQAATNANPGTVMLTALSKYKAELDEVREASKRPRSVFDLHFDESMDAMLPQLSVMKNLTVLARMSAVAHLAKGELPQAFEDVKLAFRIADSLREQPILVSQLVRVACLAIAVDAAWEGLSKQAWSDAQLRELQDLAASFDLLKDYGSTIRGERAFSNQFMEQLIRGRLGAAAFMGDTGRHLLKIGPEGWLYQNQILINRTHQDYSLPVIDAAAQRAYPQRGRELDDFILNMRTTPYTALARMLFPAFSKTAAKMTRSHTTLRFLQIACALERYRLANSEIPADLAALSPQFIPALPNDPIDAKPIRYRKETKQSYTLYSIGWDEKDDNGQPVGFKTKPPIAEREDGDWIWKLSQ